MQTTSAEPPHPERQLTDAHYGHILTNVNVWSPDGQWIVYDARSDSAGSLFDATRIERVSVLTSAVQVLYQSTHGACCGVVTCNPVDDRIVFILGPEDPDSAWHYGAFHRRGVVLHTAKPGHMENLDARDLTPPFTAGALRGGTHVHVFSGDGKWVSHTYEDHVLAALHGEGDHDRNQRNIGVSVPIRPVVVNHDHPRNHDGTFFTVLVTRTVNRPRPGSDEINRAFSDAWVGVDGYARPDGTRQHRASAFQGHVVTEHGDTIAEAFIVDIPNDVTVADRSPIRGTATRRPAPPRETRQRRLTFTAGRKYPGLQGPRHWLRSAPDGSRIAFLMKDDEGTVQLWTISPNGGEPTQLTSNRHGIESAFTWSADGHWIAHLMDRGVCMTDTRTGRTRRLTAPQPAETAPRPEACVFSPDGTQIAYVRPVPRAGSWTNQIFVVSTGTR